MSKGQRTRESIVLVGLQVWRENPDRVTMSHVGSMVGITHAAVAYHFKSSDKLRNAIAEHAVRTGDPVVVPMLLASRHPATASMTAQQKAPFLQSL